MLSALKHAIASQLASTSQVGKALPPTVTQQANVSSVAYFLKACWLHQADDKTDYKLTITPSHLRAAELDSAGKLRSSDLHSIIAPAKTDRCFSMLENRATLVKEGVPSQTTLHHLYGPTTGTPTRAGVAASPTDLRISHAIAQLMQGQRGLLIGAHPSVLQRQSIGTHIDVVDYSPDIAASTHHELIKLGYQATGAEIGHYSKDNGKTTVRLSIANITDFLKNAPKYDLIGDANAALIYHEEPLRVFNSYLYHLHSDGQLKCAVCDQYDHKQTSTNALKLKDLENYKGRMLIEGINFIDEIIAPSQKTHSDITALTLYYSDSASSKDLMNTFIQGSGKEGGVGRFDLAITKPQPFHNGQTDIAKTS